MPRVGTGSGLDPVLPAQVTPSQFVLSADLDLLGASVEVVAVPVLPSEDSTGVLLGAGAAGLADRLGLDLLELLEDAGATGVAGEVTTVLVSPTKSYGGDVTALRRVLLLGVGDLGPTALRRAGATLARATVDRGVVATTLAALGPQALEPFVVGVMLGGFGFHWGSGAPGARPAETIVLTGVEETQTPALARAVALGTAGWRSRFWATVPSNLKSPAWLAEQARELAGASERAGLTCTVLDEHDLAAGGFGGILGVGQASATPPRLIRLDYTPTAPSGRDARPVVLVGKGITFDSGGLSIKPAAAMVSMKRDMTGGGVVLATMAALADVGCPVPVIGLIAAAENAVSGHALRPGDVVRHYGGRTSEVTNTDAEGRLVLADALAYAVAELDPAVLVDVATLTGAMKVALGQHVGGCFANDETLAGVLLAAGATAGEPVWRMPLAAAYEDRLASSIADADNAPGGPGAITAALFLQHFVGGRAWAHLDVASVGDAPEERFEWTTGPTGFGARLLLEWLGRPDPLHGIGASPPRATTPS